MTEPTTASLRLYYQLGQAAALRGEPLDACRYRRADRRNGWVRGWHVGEDQRLQLEAFREAQGRPSPPRTP